MNNEVLFLVSIYSDMFRKINDICRLACWLTYLLTYLLTYSLHGEESFL